MDPDLDPDRYAVHRATVRDGVELAYVHEGVGGRPLLLLHGFPETKRIWWRNVGPLADAGFEVIVPDLRGYGDSPAAPDGLYDTASMSTDVAGLVRDVLGHATCVAAAGDLGGVVMYDLGLRFPGLVTAQCFFNSVPPALPADAVAAAGVTGTLADEIDPRHVDYFVRQGTDADGLAAELSSADRRRAYVEDFYLRRGWAASGAFDAASARFHAEPFADADALRRSFVPYEVACRTAPRLDRPRFTEPNPVPTLVLVGPEDRVTPPSFAARCAAAFPRAVGPFLVPGAGHFLQWERAELLDRSLATFLGEGLEGLGRRT
jgi:pimeloyl-ACP methyl ester carboxylesterase